MNKPHNMNVTELLDVFASALRALIPYAQRVDMPWQDGESYDDWDAIAEALWKSLVVSTIAETISGDSPLQLPRYGFVYDTYSFSDVLAVSSPGPEILVVQQLLLLDGSQASTIKLARVRRSDRMRIGHERAPLGSMVSIVRFRADGSEEWFSEISLV